MKIFIGGALLILFSLSCTHSDSENSRKNISLKEDFQEIIEGNFLSEKRYTPYEKKQRKSDGVGDDYIISQADGYSCANINDVLKNYTFKINVEDQLCSESFYQGHDVVFFVYYETHYEELPRLGYKLIFFHPTKGYIDYKIAEDDLNFQPYHQGYLDKIKQERLKGVEFPNQRWKELHSYISNGLESDLHHDVNIVWIRAELTKLQQYVSKNILSFRAFGDYTGLAEYPGISFLKIDPSGRYDCSGFSQWYISGSMEGGVIGCVTSELDQYKIIYFQEPIEHTNVYTAYLLDDTGYILLQSGYSDSLEAFQKDILLIFTQ